MIAYRISPQGLRGLIEAHKPGWTARADARTGEFRAAGRFSEKSSIWSEIKAVYMKLQGESKCIFCERKLEGLEYGAGEQAVEHFRPKGAITPWKPSRRLVDQGLKVTAPPKDARGYFLLAYHPLNYTACCHPCNSALKSSKFPVAGKYKYLGTDPQRLLAEKPLLIYAVGDFEDDPEDLIEFYGVSPRAKQPTGYERFRALVTIEFFALDDATARKNLVRERAMVIIALYPQLKNQKAGSAVEKAVAGPLIGAFTSDNAPHANCARSFVRLFEQKPAEAQALFEEAGKFVVATS